MAQIPQLKVPVLHPLDAAEVCLKQAARRFQVAQENLYKINGEDATATVREEASLELKRAARAYSETWSKYVAPAPEA